MIPQQRIVRAQSSAEDPRYAAREFFEGVAQPDMALVIFFCSPEYDRDALANEIGHLFAGVQVVGCTTAGEIGPAGCLDHSIAGVSFSTGACRAVTGLIDHLQQFEVARGQAFAQDLLQRLESHGPGADAKHSFAFLLVDGLSAREEPVARALQDALGRIPLIGGSAGDGLRFRSTQVYFEGAFHSDSAVLILVATPLPFKAFMTQHFIATEERLVVTEADATRRIVSEINGLPAAQEYARILGVEVRDLDPMRFANSPVVVLIDGRNYVRSLKNTNLDGSLSFFCAIEEGLVLRVAHGVDFVENLERAFAALRAELGPLQLVLGCDCIHRKLETLQHGFADQVEDIFQRNNAMGFRTYGEQFHGVHVNATLTGIAIGVGSLNEPEA